MAKETAAKTALKSVPATETSTGEPDKKFVLGETTIDEKAINFLVGHLTKFPWELANPVISYIQRNAKLVTEEELK